MAKKNNTTDKKGPDYDRFKLEQNEVRTLLKIKDFKEALKTLRQLDKVYGEFPPLFILWAEYNIAKGLPEDAESWFDAALESDPQNKDYYHQYARFYDNTGKHDKVIEILWRGVRRSGDPLYFYSLLEVVYGNMGMPDKAVGIVETIAREFKSSGELYYKKGEAAFALELYPDAIDLFRQSLDKGFIGENLYRYLARCFFFINHNFDGEQFLKKAIASKPDDISIYQDAYKLLLNNAITGNQDLLAAIRYKISTLPAGQHTRINLAYLGADGEFYQKCLEEYLDIAPDDLSSDYVSFCEFYKNAILIKKDFKSRYFNPVDSLLAGVIKLKELKSEPFATLYDGWYNTFAGLHGKAVPIFEMILSNQDQVPPGITYSARQGMDYIDELSESSNTESASEQPDLSGYGIELTKLVETQKILKRKGKEKAVAKLTDHLINGSIKSLILTGADGAGKTEVIKQFAHLLRSESCPEGLKNCRIIQTSTSNILSGAKYIGVWEKQLLDLCANCSWDNRIIIYLEDIENIFGAGRAEGSAKNFADYIIPRVEQNQIVLIGELDSFQAQTMFFEHPRFARVVTELKLEQPDIGEVIDILQSEADCLKVSISPDALKEIVDLTQTFMPYKAFPGKAIHLLKAVISSGGSKDKDESTRIAVDDVVLAFCESTGIPDFIVDRSQKLNPDLMDKFFTERVLGQNDAIDSAKDAVMTFKARLNNPNKPIRSFLFVGPTGVGKTELAKVISEYLFGSQEKVIRLDMSEYSDYDAASKLIGTHRGWPSKSSDFINRIRREPFSVVLLDEIEKADKNALNILLQLLGEGILKDAEGKPAYFQTTIIIMTSNLGSRFYTSQAIGFGQETNLENLRQAVLSEVKQFFSPEIYNRFDEVICFKPLTRDTLGTIVNREIGKVLQRRGIIELGIEVDIDPLVKEYVLEMGYDPKYGARHIKRAVEKAVAIPLAALIASKEIRKDDCLRINMRQGTPVADVLSPDLEDYKQAPDTTEIPLQKLTIPDKTLAKTIETIESRINSLKASLNYDAIIDERNNIQKQMISPAFWDEPSNARDTLKRFAELNRATERMHKWEKVYERIQSSFGGLSSSKDKHEFSRIRSQIIGLLKDLESAEMEILLKGKYDFADAFIILSTVGNGKDEIKWMLEMAGVYMSWARRRGYQYKIFGEQPRDKYGRSLILLFIGGMNAFGLLKNERGIHRKTLLKKSGNRKLKHNFDVEVLVLADVQPLSDFKEQFDIIVRKNSSPKKGWRLGALSKHIILSNKRLDLNLDFLADRSLEKDKNLPNDLFMSFMHYQKKKQATLPVDGQGIWGSLVRTYDMEDGSRILDHKSKIVINAAKDYLDGKIDSLLLERLI